MLSAKDILEALAAPDLGDSRMSIVPKLETKPIEERGATSVDLRLGRWFRSFKQSQNKSTVLAKFGMQSDENDYPAAQTREHFVPFGANFVLHPGRFVLGATLEWLRLPKTLSGYVTGKSSLGRHGLIIETAAGIHPSFSGCLTLELANVGEVPLEISPGMQICQLFLHRVQSTQSDSKGALSGQRKPTIKAPSADHIFQKICAGE
jgi:dCTP deaminase